MAEYESRRELILSPKMKMADLVNSRPYLLNVLDRSGIRLGFGENTVDDCCSRQGKDTSTFLSICKICLYEGVVPGVSELKSLKVDDVTSFLRNSHDSYKNEWLPRIEERISRVLRSRTEAQRKVISEFFGKFRDELQLHFDFEERKIFPLLDEMNKKGRRTKKVFHEEHTNIVEKIQDLANLLLKYLPYEDSDPDVTGLLFCLYQLKVDISIHSRIEDHMILPLLRGENNDE